MLETLYAIVRNDPLGAFAFSSLFAVLFSFGTLFYISHNNKKLRKSYEDERLEKEALRNEEKLKRTLELSRMVSRLINNDMPEIYRTQYGRCCILVNSDKDIRHDGTCSLCGEETLKKGTSGFVAWSHPRENTTYLTVKSSGIFAPPATIR